jgi:metaxin
VSQGGNEENVHMRQEAYTALIDHNIRSAWLYYLYLDQDNFRAVAWPMYVESTSSNLAVRWSIGYQLQTAAREELLKTNTIVDGHELYKTAEDAFRALSTLLGEDKFFFGQTTPGLFDASLFAYTQIILDEGVQWRTTTLKTQLQQYDNLVRHRNQLMRGFFRASHERNQSIIGGGGR